MKKRNFVRVALRAPLALAALTLFTSGWAQAQSGLDRAGASGRLILMQRAGLPAAELERALKPHGARARRLGNSDLHIVELPAGASETAVQQLLQRNPHFRFVERDQQVPKAFVANDPYAGSQWHLPITRTPTAWDSARGAGVTIAVLDGGVLASHGDLMANLLPGYNAWDGGTTTTDINNHGTAVAGVAAAVMNNSVGVSGVAGAARILPVRITDYSGTAWYSSIVSGIIYAADRGVRVVNCSYVYLWGNASVQSAGNYLKSKGGLLVVAAGNNGINENAAATSSMITVSATDSGDQLAGWSSWGNMVSVAAPGVGIWTTAANGAYESASGTSFATPVVAGLVALMMSANPSLSSSQVESLLYSTATDLGATGRDIYFGHGRINSEAAVRAARDAAAADTQRPTAAITSPTAGSFGGLLTVDVSASDNVGVSRVELRANGNLVASDTVAPYQFTLDTRNFVNGAVSLTAVAVDAANNSQTSAAVSVTVANAVVVDTTAPIVAITSPASGAGVSGTVQISVAASDNAGAAGIRQEIYVDGVLRASGTGGSLSTSWNSRKAALGPHALSVVAIDAAGNRSVSSISVNRVK